MFEDMFDEMGDNPIFQKLIINMVEKMQMQVSNDLKLGELTVDDDIVKEIWYSLIANRTGFEFMRNLNLILNGADETAYGNVNKFIGQIEMVYNAGEDKKNEIMNKERGF